MADVGKVLEELLGEQKVPHYMRARLQNSRPDKQTMRETYWLLRGWGLDESRVARYAYLLGIEPTTIEETRQKLLEHGLNHKSILTQPLILGMNPEHVERNYAELIELGLIDEEHLVPSTLILLLPRSPEILKRNYEALQELGLSKEQITATPNLLSYKPDTIRKRIAFLQELGLKFEEVIRFSYLLPRNLERKVQELRTLGITDAEIREHMSIIMGGPAEIKRFMEQRTEMVRMKETLEGLLGEHAATIPEQTMCALAEVGESAIREAYAALRALGAEDRYIAVHAKLLVDPKKVKGRYRTQKLLEELLGEDIERIPPHGWWWIERTKMDENTIRSTYALLRAYGLDNSRIASNANLFCLKQETIKENYTFLREIGLEEDRVGTYAILLVSRPERLQKNYEALQELGLSDEAIRKYLSLLGRKPATLRKNYKQLLKFGVSKEKILANPSVLGLPSKMVEERCQKLLELGFNLEETITRYRLVTLRPEIVEQNYRLLQEIGFTYKTIHRHLHVLNRNPDRLREDYEALLALGLTKKKIRRFPRLLETKGGRVQETYEELRKLGLSREKVLTYESLLRIRPETLRRNYQHHVGLLREDHQDRNSGRALLLQHPWLLLVSPEAMEANVQYLSMLGIDYHNGSLLETMPKTKRKILTWLLREQFDYRAKKLAATLGTMLGREEAHDAGRECIDSLYRFVREHSPVLGYIFPSYKH
ncbi:hypothetical protein HYS48_04085 [Candidatus Woesearchaeota archaeon]|nr:hypothetical protein [Candidatus Woesearchaeota archaeon]